MADVKWQTQDRTKVILYGIGSIGIRVAKIVLNTLYLELVGIIDRDPEKVGKDIGDLLSLNEKMDIVVSSSLPEVTSKTKVDIAIHTTCSFLKGTHTQILEVLSSAINCVSSTEELFFPYLQDLQISERLNKAAKEHGVTLLATGVNPGFAMDSLPLFLTSVCQEVKRVRIERVVDVTTRRLPLQKKVGVTLTPEQFYQKAKKKEIGHVGLIQSVAFVAHNLGRKLDDIEETLDPVIAEKDLSTEYFLIQKGKVAGIKQVASGIRDGEKLITLNVQMYVGADDPRDSITIEGTPSLNVNVPGGIAGDIATAAILVNCVPLVVRAEPGLITMMDLPLVHYIGNAFNGTSKKIS